MNLRDCTSEGSWIENMGEKAFHGPVVGTEMMMMMMMMLGQQTVSLFQAQLQRMRRSETCQI